MIRALYLAARLAADPTPTTSVDTCTPATDPAECVAWLEDWRSQARGESESAPGRPGTVTVVPRLDRALHGSAECGR